MKTQNITQEDLAEALELTPGAVSHYLRDRRQPSPEQMLKIAQRLGVTVSRLMGDEVAGIADPEAVYHATDDRVFVNKVHGARLSAGNGENIYDFEEVDGSHAFDRHWMQKRGLKPERCKIWEVSGDSMWPTIPSGTTVLLNMAEREPANGQLFALAGEDGLRLKRLIRRSDGVWEIHSDNPIKSLYPTETMLPGQVAILGRVRWYAIEPS